MVGALTRDDRISLLVSDIDGTLVKNDKSLTPASVRAAEKLAEAGVKLALVSSRPPAGFAMLTAVLKLKAPLGAFNGGMILNPDLSVIEAKLVPSDAAVAAVTAFHRYGIDAWLFTADTWYVLNAEETYIPRERRTLQREPVVVPSFEPYYDQVGKLVGASNDFDAVARCGADLQRRLGTRATAERSQAYYIDVTPAGADKGYAVRRIAAVLNIPIEEVAVIGDMANDLPMFAVGTYRIAMGNGIQVLKDDASFVTDSNENDGFAAAVERYVLPRAALAHAV